MQTISVSDAINAHNEANPIGEDVGDIREPAPEVKRWTSTAGPRQTKQAQEHLANLGTEHNRHTEKYGILGGEEHTSTLWNIFGTTVRQDVKAVQLALGEKFNWTITRENFGLIIAEVQLAMVELAKNRPCDDKRQTAEARTAQQEEWNQAEREREAAREAKSAVFLLEYGEPGEAVLIADGQMAVVLQLCYDDSDGMSDYSAPHCSLGEPLAIAIVPKGARTESLARLVQCYTAFESNDYGFKWHTENYSMGHGNYLQGPGFELPAHIDKPKGLTHGHWEVQFRRAGEKVHKLKGFPGNAGGYHAPAATSGGNGNGTTVAFNSEHNGVEIAFPGKPASSVIGELKGAGFRWSPRSRVWYKKFGSYAWAAAHRIAGIELQPEPKRESSTPSTGDKFDMAVEDQMAAAVGA